MSSWPGVFKFSTFFSVALCYSFCIIITWVFWGVTSLSFFFHFYLHLAFLLHSILCRILLQINFVSFAKGCWNVRVHSPPTCSFNFLSLFSKVNFWSYCLSMFRYLLDIPSFGNIFGFISSSYFVRFFAVCVDLFIPAYYHAFPLHSIFACSGNLFICPLNLITHPDFVLLFGFLWGTPIWSYSNFASA